MSTLHVIECFHTKGYSELARLLQVHCIDSSLTRASSLELLHVYCTYYLKVHILGHFELARLLEVYRACSHNGAFRTSKTVASLLYMLLIVSHNGTFRTSKTIIV